VSHDIKTPLTSIINYVDLLKRRDIQDEKTREYIEILDQKSMRLKTLTEDLVEASKITSGNIKIEPVKLDMGMMISQMEGETAEKFEAAGLTLVTTLPDEPVYIYADGRRLFRVLDNIYGNVAKYAMPDTRVYADLKADEKRAEFTLKNISKQALNIDASELTERFIRGDVSRSTEGSGLGLSIAESLTELQNGEFRVDLDGDLFKLTIGFERLL
jgi:signal transduction histidine kinase